MRHATWKALLWFGVLCLASLMSGCAGMEHYPKQSDWYYVHKELPAADRAVEAARTAGKDRECPAEFQAADKMRRDAWDIYKACRTREAIAKANEATAQANALCPMKADALRPQPRPAASWSRPRRRLPPFPFRRARPRSSRGNARP